MTFPPSNNTPGRRPADPPAAGDAAAPPRAGGPLRYRGRAPRPAGGPATDQPLNGHATNHHATNHHATNGHATNGHAIINHPVDGGGANGHATKGHATKGHATGGHQADGDPAGDPVAGRYQVNGGWPAARTDPPYRCGASLSGGLVLLAAIWLVVSRFVFNYPAAGGGINGSWNGVYIGAVIALIAIARMLAATANPILSLVSSALGGWMIAAPWVFGYDLWTAQPVWSDLTTGLVIATAGLADWALGPSRRARRAGRYAGPGTAAPG